VKARGLKKLTPFIMIFLPLFLGQEALSGSSRHYFVDGSGSRLRLLNIEFGVVTSNLTEVVSTPFTLRLVDASSPGTIQQLVVLSGTCTIGGRRVEPKNIKVLLNNKSSVSLAEAKAGIQLLMVVKNLEHREGVLNCEGFDFLLQ
jgi:hypothetical protein